MVVMETKKNDQCVSELVRNFCFKNGGVNETWKVGKSELNMRLYNSFQTFKHFGNVIN